MTIWMIFACAGGPGHASGDNGEGPNASSPDADDDGDGYTNGEEAAYGSDPEWPYSHPFTGNYNVGHCAEEPVPTGPSAPSETVDIYQVGDVVENFTLIDQHGEMVDLYAFCGQTVLLAFGTPDCGVCQSLAAVAQEHQDTYGSSNVQMIEILLEDMLGNEGADAETLTTWADSFGLETVPVLANGLEAGVQNYPGQYFPWLQYEMDFTVPTTVVVGPDMRVLSVDAFDWDPGPWL